MADDGGKVLSYLRSLLGVTKEFNAELEKTDSLMGGVSAKTAGGTGSPGGAIKSSSTTAPYPGYGGAPVAGAGGAPQLGGSYNNAATGTGAPIAPGQQGTAKFSYGWGQALSQLTKTTFSAGLMGMTALPTTQEAIAYDTLSNRLRFYSQNGMKDYGNPSMYAAKMGTPNEPLDALMASNVGIEAGLLPGLSNYQAGTKGNKSFGGVYGSAALASNLVPGMGIQGGMSVVGNINRAQNVNMLRMFGIDIRGGDGSKPADLASIIDQLYNILSKSGAVSPYSIAVSAMSGNALDSILTQYFGEDVNTRNVVIAGLIQRSRKGSLYTSGTKAALQSTGGLGTAAVSLGNRTTSEYGMIKNLSAGAVAGEVGANNALQGLYDKLGKMSGSSIKNAQYGVGMLEGILGARGGAGAAVLNSITEKNDLAAVMGGVFAGIGNGMADAKIGGLQNNALFNGKPRNIAGIATSGGNTLTPATGPSFSGGLTINLQLPPGTDDPMLFGKAVSTAMQGMYYQ